MADLSAQPSAALNPAGVAASGNGLGAETPAYPSSAPDSNTGLRAAWCKRLLRAVRTLLVVGFAIIAELAISVVLQNRSAGSSRYDAPLLVVYINHAATGVCCLLAGRMLLWRKGESLEDAVLARGFASIRAGVGTASWLSIIFMMYNIFWALSILLTSLHVFTTIAQSYCVLVMGLSVCLLGEKVTSGKCVGVLLTLCGVALVGFRSFSEPGDSSRMDGILSAICFTLGQAVFTVLWGYYFDDADGTAVLVFLGLLGTTGIVMCAPVLAAFFALGLEAVPAVPTPQQGISLAIVALLAVLNNFTLMFAISLTSPLILAIGKSMEIPLSALYDFFDHGEVPPLMQGLGMIAVTAGFLVMTVEGSKADRSDRARSFLTDSLSGSRLSRQTS